MTNRVEIKNAYVNNSRLRARQMTAAPGPDGTIVLTPAPGATELEASPGQTMTLHVGETAGQILVINELPA